VVADASLRAADSVVVDRERLVVVADSDVELGKATVSQLLAWGLQPVLVHDGVEAMLTIQRMLPRAVVLDAALPKMYGFQVCEVIKRNASLRNTGVILVAAIHNRDRYRRQPVELYGADYYIEQPDLPDGLRPLFEQMGMTLPGSPVAPTPAPPPSQPEVDANAETQTPPPAPQAPQAAPAQPAGQPLSDEHAAAERLARIIVSDIALYQPEKFAQGIAAGNVVEAMDNEIGEGRVLFTQRIDEKIRAERDFIVDELIRVARERGME
jgi:CheY-like chemotaxis protein